MATDDPPRSSLGRLGAALRRHPIICLLLLTPGIPEYLSTSSSLTLLFVNPVAFFIFLGANVGIYLPGALLIREAMVRWRKGWASVLVLGAAYGILEEGIGLSTLFNPASQVVGNLGYYGHWLGVNWFWLPGVLAVHMIFSMSVPILLLGLAVPETRGKSLLTGGQIPLVFGILATDIGLLMAFVAFGLHFWMGFPLLVASIGTIVALVVVAYLLPPDLLRAVTPAPRTGRLGAAVLGTSFFPVTLVAEGLLVSAHAPPFAVDLAILAWFGVVLVLSVRFLGHGENQGQLVAFVFGLVLPIAVFGFVLSLPTPVVAVADGFWFYFMRRMFIRYRPVAAAPTIPPGALYARTPT